MHARTGAIEESQGKHGLGRDTPGLEKDLSLCPWQCLGHGLVQLDMALAGPPERRHRGHLGIYWFLPHASKMDQIYLCMASAPAIVNIIGECLKFPSPIFPSALGLKFAHSKNKAFTFTAINK